MSFKRYWQLFLYLIDINIITIPFLIISLYIQPITQISTHLFDVFERYTICFIFHQVIVLIINKNSLDAEKDAFLAYKTALTSLLIYMENPLPDLRNNLEEKFNNLTGDDMLMQEDIKCAIEALKPYLSLSEFTKDQKTYIQMEENNASHHLEYCQLSWRNTIFLHKLK